MKRKNNGRCLLLLNKCNVLSLIKMELSNNKDFQDSENFFTKKFPELDN